MDATDCSGTNLDMLSFTAMSGVNRNVEVRQNVTSEYYLYNDTTDSKCKILVVYEKDLPTGKVVLGDPFISANVLSFNPYL